MMRFNFQHQVNKLRKGIVLLKNGTGKKQPDLLPVESIDMEKYYRMVIDLYKEALLINRVNPDRVLDAQREISNAITTAIITNEPTSELELLKSDIENLKSHISQ